MIYKYNNEVESSNKNDLRLIKFIWLFYFIQVLNTSIKLVFRINDIQWSFLSSVFMIMLLISLIYNLNIVVKRNIVSFIIIELVFIFLFIVSMILGYSEFYILAEFALWTLGIGIPLAIFFYSIRNKSLFLFYSLRYSRIILTLLVISFIFLNAEITYTMSLSYFMLLPLIILILKSSFLPSKVDSILIILSFLSLLLLGARGPLIGIIYIYIVITLRSLMQLKYRTIFKYLLITISIIVYISFNGSINEYILNLLRNLGIYSRTLNRLLSGDLDHFLENSGRSDLWAYYINLVLKRPFTGWGIGGGWLSRGIGPHNGILEIYLAQGIIIGTFLSLAFIIMLILPLFFKKYRNNILYVSYAAVNTPLLISAGDILVKYNLFIFVAVFCYVFFSKIEIDKKGESSILLLNQL